MFLWDLRSPTRVGAFGPAGPDGRHKCAPLAPPAAPGW